MNYGPSQRGSLTALATGVTLSRLCSVSNLPSTGHYWDPVCAQTGHF